MSWWQGGAGKGQDLLDFYLDVCRSRNVLSVRNFSYRHPSLPVGGIYHLNADAELELSVEQGSLFGTFNLKSISDSQAFKDKITEDKKKLLLKATDHPPKLRLDGMQNYQVDSRVSLYSGDPCCGESWSFHCSLPGNPTRQTS